MFGIGVSGGMVGSISGGVPGWGSGGGVGCGPGPGLVIKLSDIKDVFDILYSLKFIL